MSIAPAKRASMAEGPALKLVHCSLTCGPIALSNQPLALPTIACACVIFGKAPTRTTVWPPCPQATEATTIDADSASRKRLVTLLASNHHGEDAGGISFLGLHFGSFRWPYVVIRQQIGQRSVLKDPGGRIAHIEKDLIKSSLRQVAFNQFA